MLGWASHFYELAEIRMGRFGSFLLTKFQYVHCPAEHQ